MNNGYRIVKMTRSHIDEVVEIEKANFSEPWSRYAFIESVENLNAYFICAVRSVTRLVDDIVVNADEVLGYAGMYYVLGSVSDDGETVWLGGAEIANIAVRADMRRAGIATTLMNALEEEARALLLGELMLEVRQSNYPARALYEKLGFAMNGLRKNYYRKPREDAILMQKDIKNVNFSL